MPYSKKEDSGMTPLRYTKEEWDEEIYKFWEKDAYKPSRKHEDMHDERPSFKQEHIIAVLYEPTGWEARFWTDKWAITLRSACEDTYNGTYDSIEFEMVERNPPIILSM